MQRYRCRACRRTFNALTGTPLSGLRHKGRWLSFGGSLASGESVRKSAKRCGVCTDTAFRWRHRFLEAAATAPGTLTGVVEADELFQLISDKGVRGLARKPRKRGGKASKPGRSKEQAVILVATDRGGTTFVQVIGDVSAESLAASLGPVVAKDALLVTDGHPAYPPCAKALGIRHEAVNLSAGVRVRGLVHIQTVNSRHSQLRDFLRRFRGVSTRYLGNYMRWLHLKVYTKHTTARACLAAIVSRVPTHNQN